MDHFINPSNIRAYVRGKAKFIKIYVIFELYCKTSNQIKANMNCKSSSMQTIFCDIVVRCCALIREFLLILGWFYSHDYNRHEICGFLVFIPSLLPLGHLKLETNILMFTFSFSAKHRHRHYPFIPTFVKNQNQPFNLQEMIIVKDVVLQIVIISHFMNIAVDQSLVFHHRHNHGRAFYEVLNKNFQWIECT